MFSFTYSLHFYSFHLEDMAGQVLFNVWMEGIVYDCILLGVLMGLRTMELWEIMTSSDVRAIAQYLKKNFFFSKFRVKIECSWSYGSNEPRILKFPKFRLNWGINTLLRYKFGLKIDFIRVWPWKIVELSYILRYTTHFEVHAL